MGTTYMDQVSLRLAASSKRTPAGLLALVAFFFTAAPSAAENFTVRSGTLAVEVSAEGHIVAVRSGQHGLRRAVDSSTVLAGFTQHGAAVTRKIAQGGVEVTTSLVDASKALRCRLVERFRPGRESIRWEIEIQSGGAPWTTAIQTHLRYPATPGVRFWTAWSDPENQNVAPRRQPVTQWNDPLAARPLTRLKYFYGAPIFTYEDPNPRVAPLCGDLLSIPIATFMEPNRDFGVSLIFSPEDDLLDLTLATDGNGGIEFARYHHRISGAHTPHFAMDLVAHEADWRGGLRWMAARYPEYFNPVIASVHEMGGTSAYSAEGTDFDAALMKKMAFRTNWKASFDFPYMGMFLPPVEGETWQRYSGESGKGGPTSIAAMAEYSRRMRALGFHVLNYFNVTEFGADIVFPPPPRRANAEANLWKDSNGFLYGALADAILYVPASARADAWGKGRTGPNRPYYTWGAGIAMDCGEPSYRQFLLEQAKRHIEKLQESSGICIDRLDWLRFYNERRDDGLSWFVDKPARSLLVSWKGLMKDLGPMMHEAGNVIFVNNHDKRLDLLHSVDGIFDEFTSNGAALNTTALLCIRRPALGWTNREEEIKSDPDGFFQRFLYLGVWPMAPFPGNDHSLTPSAWVNQQYLDYGPLMDAMRGRQWVLEPHAAKVEGDAARANLFETPDGYIAPVMLGGTAPSVKLVLRGLHGTPQSAAALHPGHPEWVNVPFSRRGATWVLDVPLKRGCAMVRVTR